MAAELPRPLTTYFTATNAHDIDRMLVPFADNATVRDEGRERAGRAAIRAWMEETVTNYAFTAEPKDVNGTSAQPVVTAVVTGNFPGSPVELTYRFTLENSQIVRLEIG